MTKVTSQEILVLTAKDFARGMSTDKYSADGFFSNEMYAGINLTYKPGTIYGQPQATDLSPSSSGIWAATCKGGGSSSGLGYQNNYGVTESNKFYTYNGSAWTLGATGGGAKQYIGAKTDMVFYKENLFITSDVDITLATLSSYVISAINESWWVSTKGKASLSNIFPHPMVIFEDILWIADGPYLHKWDGTTATAQAFTLTDDQNITALAVDPSSGRMMIATTQGANASGTLPRMNKISFWDGTSSKVLRAVPVEGMVTAFQPVGGTMYVAYGRNIGYWNGSGISWLRTLSKITSYSAFKLPYKHRMTSIENTLYVVDGSQILAYESVLAGYPKIFYYVYGAINGTPPILTLTTIQDFGEGYLGISHQDASGANYFMKFPTRSMTVGSSTDAFQSILTNFFVFKKKVRIKMIKLFFADYIEANKSPWGITVYGTDNQNPVVFSRPYTASAGYELEYIPRQNTMKELEDFFLYLYDGDSSYTSGIRKISIYYDYVE